MIVTITSFDKLESCHVGYISKSAFAFVRTHVFVMFLSFPLKFSLNFMAPKFCFGIMIIVVIFW